MFKFDFDLAADEMDEDLGSQLTGPSQSDVSQSPMVSADYGGPETSQFNEHTLESLVSENPATFPPRIRSKHMSLHQIQALPGVISYSPLQIPAVSGFSSGMYLSKRDLYDARFQLISSGSGEDEIAHNTTPAVADLDNDLQYVQAPSDLVQGKYEGGLKTWECSIDLAACVKSSMDANILTRKRLRTLEVRFFRTYYCWNSLLPFRSWDVERLSLRSAFCSKYFPQIHKRRGRCRFISRTTMILYSD